MMRCVQLWMENPSDQSQIPSVEVKGGKQRGSGARKAGALLSSDRTFCLCSNVPSRLKPNVISEVAPDPGHLGAIVGDARAIKSQSRRDVGSPRSLQGVYPLCSHGRRHNQGLDGINPAKDDDLVD